MTEETDDTTTPAREDDGSQQAGDGGEGASDPRLDRVLADAFPGRSTAVLADWSSREPNGVYRVRVDGEEYVCKFARDDDRRRFAREVAALERAHEAGLAPEVVAAGVEADADTELPPYHVTRPLPGSTPAETWADLPVDADGALFRRLGTTLARLHERTASEECGRIVGGRDGRLDLSPRGDWHAVLLDLARRRVADLEDTRFEIVAAEALACVGRHPEVRRGARPALVHNDPGVYNVVLADGEVAGLVDWELAFVGDGAYDLVSVEDALRDGPADPADPEAAVRALYDGYRDRIPERAGFERRRAVYRLVRALRPLRTFDSWGPDLAADREETVADLADRLRDSVRDRIAAVEDAGDRDPERGIDASDDGAGSR